MNILDVVKQRIDEGKRFVDMVIEVPFPNDPDLVLIVARIPPMMKEVVAEKAAAQRDIGECPFNASYCRLMAERIFQQLKGWRSSQGVAYTPELASDIHRNLTLTERVEIVEAYTKAEKVADAGNAPAEEGSKMLSSTGSGLESPSCGECAKRQLERKQRPLCWSRRCKTAEYQNPVIDMYLMTWQMLRTTESIPRGMLLKELGMADFKTLNLMAELDRRCAILQQEKS